MSVLIPTGVSPTGETVTRVIEGIGTVKFENYGPGEWMTKKGEPAKKARRRYLLDDKHELDSVSSIVDTLDKYALRVWIETEATLGAVAAERMDELSDVPPEDWVTRIKSLGLGATAKKQEACDRGTVIHAGMHTLAEGKVPDYDQFPGTARHWVQGSVRAWLAMNPQSVSSELIVCNPEHRYAGRLDLLARVDDLLTLIDYKTGKGKVFDSAHYQTRLYEMALRAEGVRVDQILIVGIDDDGDFQPVKCEATDEDALALLHTFRSRKRINSGMAAQRAAAKAAA